MKKHTTEYLLKKHLGNNRDGSYCFSDGSNNNRPYCFVLAKTGRVRVYEEPVNGEARRYIGQFYIHRWSKDNTVYFRSFEISPRLRGQGIGTAIFPHILDYLYSTGCRNVVLQVSDSNPAALSLYKNNGFEVIESVII